MSKVMVFGQWLKQRRKALGLTQRDLAQQANCAEVTLRKIEAGDLHPSAQLVASLIKCLGVTDADLPDLQEFALGTKRRTRAGRTQEQVASSQQPAGPTDAASRSRARHLGCAQPPARRRSTDHAGRAAGRRQDPTGLSGGRDRAGAVRTRRLLCAPGADLRS